MKKITVVSVFLVALAGIVGTGYAVTSKFAPNSNSVISSYTANHKKSKFVTGLEAELVHLTRDLESYIAKIELHSRNQISSDLYAELGGSRKSLGEITLRPSVSSYNKHGKGTTAFIRFKLLDPITNYYVRACIEKIGCGNIEHFNTANSKNLRVR